MKLLRLFREMVLLSALVLGGGYVILSVADSRFSKKKYGWIRSGELFEMLPLFQMIPGIIGGHTAIYLGYRVAGCAGSVVALIGMALPSVLVFLMVSIVYRSLPVGAPLMSAAFLVLRAALTGLLAEMVGRTWRKSVTGVYGYLAILGATAAILVAHVSPACVIATGAVVGILIETARRGSERRSRGTRVFGSFGMIPLLFFGFGLMAFGGGFVLVPAYMREFVGAGAPYLKLDAADFANVMALTEMTPGPVAVNCTTFFGYELGGALGAVIATLALLLPGSLILLLALRSLDRFRANLIVRGLFAGVRPVTTALLVCATWSFAGMSVWHASPAGPVFSPLGATLAAVAYAIMDSRARR